MPPETNTSAIPALQNLLGQEKAEQIIASRRHIHQQPEIGLDTPETAAFIKTASPHWPKTKKMTDRTSRGQGCASDDRRQRTSL